MKRYYLKVAVPEIMPIRHSSVFELEEKSKAVKSDSVPQDAARNKQYL